MAPYRAEDLWRWPMAERKARSEAPEWLAQAASGLDANSGEIIAHNLTEQVAGAASQREQLLDQIDYFTADGAYDGTLTYDAVLPHSGGDRVIIPPCSNAIERASAQAKPRKDGVDLLRHFVALGVGRTLAIRAGKIPTGHQGSVLQQDNAIIEDAGVGHQICKRWSGMPE